MSNSPLASRAYKYSEDGVFNPFNVTQEGRICQTGIPQRAPYII